MVLTHSEAFARIQILMDTDDFDNDFGLIRELPDAQKTHDPLFQRLKQTHTEKSPLIELLRAERKRKLKVRFEARKRATLDKSASNEELEESETPRRVESELVSRHDVDIIRTAITKQLLGNFSWIDELSLSDKYKELYTMFEQTVRDHEGHSVLVVGPRGSGKSLVVNQALAKLDKVYPNRSVVVQLLSVIHSDDNVALREIARQMDAKWREVLGNSTSEAVFELRLVNDTFANILTTLESANNDNVAIFFVIDEFDKFATTLARQTLLYNLFELSQTLGNPICIVGMTTRITTHDLLEKRVLSRFSQHIIGISTHVTIDAWWTDAKQALILREPALLQLETRVYGDVWNQWVDTAYASHTTLLRLAFDVFTTTKSFRQFNNYCVPAVAALTQSNPIPDEANLVLLKSNSAASSTQLVVSGLLILEQLVAIAAARQIERGNTDGVINFTQAYDEYKLMMTALNVTNATQASTRIDKAMLAQFQISQKVWSPDVVKNCWAKLYKMKLLCDATGVTTNNDGHIITNVSINRNLVIEDSKMVQLDVTLMELRQLIPDSSIYRRLTLL